MKMNKMIIAGAMLISLASYAQKDELKALKKIYAKDEIKAADVVEYKAALAKLEPLAVEEGDKVYLNFYKSMAPLLEMTSMGANATPSQIARVVSPQTVADLAVNLNATLEYEKKTGKKVYTDDINQKIQVYSPQLVQVAATLGSAKKYNEAASFFNAIYQLNKKDTDNLYYAASFAVNGNDYDSALKYYTELRDIKYTGEGTIYYAYNKGNKKEESFPSKELRDTFIKTGTHEKPRDEKIASKVTEIYKTIPYILVEKGKTDEAKQAFKEARKVAPDDVNLILSEANLYFKQHDYETYSKLVNEALAKDPNNAELVFNLGVINGDANKLEEAEKYYRRAFEIDPAYFNAYLGLAELKLRSDKKYVEEINKLGTTDKELKRYEVLKAERNKNFTSILPILEKALELKPDDEDTKRTLLSVYNALEMTDKYKALKAKM